MAMKPLYILPNLFTASSIFLAIFSVAMAHSNDYQLACWLVVASMIMDGLDGRVARLTKTSSRFGFEFDSLADIVAFGVAPAIILYLYLGSEYGRFGITVSALFVIFGAIRLARFNTTTNNEPNYFIGLPIPSGAISIVSLILLDVENNGSILSEYGELLLILSFALGILMVSNVRYPSFKKNEWDFKSFVMLVILLGFMFARPVIALCIVMNLYVLYGIIRWVFIVCRFIIFKRRSDK